MDNGEGPPSQHRRRTALLLVDVINDMEFEGSEPLVRLAESMAGRLQGLKRRARADIRPSTELDLDVMP